MGATMTDAAASGLLDVAGASVSILDIGTNSLLVIVFLMAITGRLMGPKSIARLEKEAEDWREAYMKVQAQKDELLMTGRVTQQVLRAVEDVTTGGGDEQ